MIHSLSPHLDRARALNRSRAARPQQHSFSHAPTRASPEGRSACPCEGACPRCARTPPSATRPQQGGSTLAGNASLAPAQSHAPDPITANFGRWASYTTVSGPDFNASGVDPFFSWSVDFQTSLQTGYLVQKIVNSWVAQNCDGTPFNGREPTPTYWERWYFQNGVNQTPKDSVSGANDRWERGLCEQGTWADPCAPYRQATSGVWAMTGELYVYPSTDLDGFSSTRSGRADAGVLEYSLTEPKEDLGRAFAKRTIAGRWDFCGGNNIHVQV
jgi:hypothetical protein